MASPSNASRAFVALLALGVASLALLGALLWQQGVQLAQGVWLACQSAAQAVEETPPDASLSNYLTQSYYRYQKAKLIPLT